MGCSPKRKKFKLLSSGSSLVVKPSVQAITEVDDKLVVINTDGSSYELSIRNTKGKTINIFNASGNKLVLSVVTPDEDK